MTQDRRHTSGELQGWANQRPGKQQRIRHLELREALPRNVNGKLLKPKRESSISGPEYIK
jgi:hypothetical protein